MAMKNFVKTASAVVVAASLAACAPFPSGSSATISATGVITGFGSVFINGVKYEVENGTVVASAPARTTAGSEPPHASNTTRTSKDPPATSMPEPAPSRWSVRR